MKPDKPRIKIISILAGLCLVLCLAGWYYLKSTQITSPESALLQFTKTPEQAQLTHKFTQRLLKHPLFLRAMAEKDLFASDHHAFTNATPDGIALHKTLLLACDGYARLVPSMQKKVIHARYLVLKRKSQPSNLIQKNLFHVGTIPNEGILMDRYILDRIAYMTPEELSTYYDCLYLAVESALEDKPRPIRNPGWVHDEMETLMLEHPEWEIFRKIFMTSQDYTQWLTAKNHHKNENVKFGFQWTGICSVIPEQNADAEKIYLQLYEMADTALPPQREILSALLCR